MVYPPPHSRARSRWRPRPRSALIVVGIVVFVCCVAASGLGVWNLQAIWRAQDPARQQAVGFLSDVTAGEVSSAYDRLCVATREKLSLPAFTARVENPPRIVRHDITKVSIATDDGEFTGTITAKITWDSGMVTRRELTMITESGQWRVCGEPL